MKLRQTCGSYFALLIALASFATEARASCPGVSQGPPCQEYWRSEAVFIGVVNRVVGTPNIAGLEFGPYLRSTVYLTVEEVFKGVEGTGIVLELDSCGYPFKEGERYLIYTHRNPNNKQLDVRVGHTRTRPIAEATEDLTYIRGLPTAEPGSRVFGKVVQQSHNLKENRFDVESLKNVKVTLEGNDLRQEVVTDSDGRYEIKGLPAGTYRVRTEIPQGFRYDEPTIKVNGRECVPLDLAAISKGDIAGRVVDVNGKPLDSVPLSLVPADLTFEQIISEGKERRSTAMTWTDKQGRYRFTQLAPGRYLLIINRTEQDAARGTTISRSLPRLFYPGVSDPSSATVIVISKDIEPREYEFRLPVQQ